MPLENRIGEEGKGWTYAKYLLGHERTGIASVGRSKWQLARLKNVAREEQEDGRPLIEDETSAMQIAEVEADLQALEAVVLKVSQEEAGQGLARFLNPEDQRHAHPTETDGATVQSRWKLCAPVYRGSL